MGYARLHFPNNNTILTTHVLYDIVGCLTGTFTATNQLQTATQTLSQIVNTANSNWSFVYPASHGTKGTTNTSWVLSSPCVTASKTKYIRLTSFGGGAIAQSGTFTYYDSALNSGNNAGILMQACTAASSATVLTNPAWYNTNNSSGTYTNAVASNFIYLHWSNRHCLIYGGYTSNLRKGFQALFEHQETGITTFRNTAPVVYINYTSSNGGWNSTETAPSSIAGSPNIVQVLNHFNVNTATATGVYNVLSDINSQQDHMSLLSDAASGAYPSTTTKNSGGAVARQVQPLYWHQHHIGVPHQYVSQLSNVYRTAPSMGSEGDTVTIGNDTYVYLPTEYNSYNLLVKRA